MPNKILSSLLLVVSIMLVSCASDAKNHNVYNLRYEDTKSDSRVVQQIASQHKYWNYTPYSYGGNSRKGIDCSALVMNIFKHQYDIVLPRVTSQQAKYGQQVNHLIAGDLIFFKTGKGNTGLHVGIYYKNGMFLHVSSSRGVELASLSNNYWKSHYWMARRVI